MHPIQFAQSRPDHPAIIMAGSGEIVTYREMDEAANRIAHWLRSQGLQDGDAFGVLMENNARYHEMYWASQRAGTVLVPISTHLTASEILYILDDSDAKLLVSTRKFDAVTDVVRAERSDLGLLIFGVDAEQTLAAQPSEPIADQSVGRVMLYSSGTTGRPKGILPAPPEDPAVEAPTPLMGLATMGFQIKGDGSCVYLSPAPLYHAAPLGWSSTIHRLGGTVVVMEKFDPEGALATIEKYGITDSQWVPTHFVRMLKLPEAIRTKYDLSTHKGALHAAAPCPVDIKKEMIEWWGPIIFEYYAGSEGNGMTMVGSADWMTHQGTVGRAILGTIHICDDNGDEVPVGDEGVVFFESPYPFEYHKDDAKTKEATHPKGWTTLGDIGKLDEEGFLYLTDRRSNMIISGGVNIYPQEIENLLITHDKVMDAAVIGAPCPEMGEKVVAVVQPVSMDGAGETLEAELTDFLSGELARLKMPRIFDFRAELPREANGKLYKRKLKDEYLQAAGTS
ncbi:acyl-CoA synthetase [Pontixanthobacter aestiaquae]|uniref:AMP-binding protein n=1 Tax=Pontixanthobacter aestiaquae TaxID=1509367 RepID=A0A844Z0K9_9SPHN|nr:acyl-CoA synthetase [Pontixanthobacter aestiaquae]MDN3646756.1 acyl-CoA synthetase [Pontixanthobacter aestiaquae]MXO82261.1 AMP-binding protein [Pontixanthobacter aestiaquae]